MKFYHYIFIIAQLWLASHPRSTVVSSEDADGAIELTSSKAIAGKELSLSSWCTASLFIR